MKDLFEVEIVEIEGKEKLIVKKNKFFTSKDASDAKLVNPIREVKEELEERGSINE